MASRDWAGNQGFARNQNGSILSAVASFSRASPCASVIVASLKPTMSGLNSLSSAITRFSRSSNVSAATVFVASVPTGLIRLMKATRNSVGSGAGCGVYGSGEGEADGVGSGTNVPPPSSPSPPHEASASAPAATTASHHQLPRRLTIDTQPCSLLHWQVTAMTEPSNAVTPAQRAPVGARGHGQPARTSLPSLRPNESDGHWPLAVGNPNGEWRTANGPH
ncbi:MAG: hypothetical protein M5U18_13975 [Dehalococcoidia bacterium]|nr:hypothetical protein [Dehalococcoidia bacterium]